MEIIVVVILEHEVGTVRSKTTLLFPGCEEAELQSWVLAGVQDADSTLCARIAVQEESC